jgi:hypothetical protein
MAALTSGVLAERTERDYEQQGRWLTAGLSGTPTAAHFHET